MNTPAIQLLQVFNGGKACGWLGQSANGYWFHYSSNSTQQSWVSLLVPPSTNFYQQATLFQVFAQHLPLNKSTTSPLNFLHERDGKHLSSLSFANPDNPVIKAPQRVLPQELPLLDLPNLQATDRVLLSTQLRKPFADTVVYHPSAWPLVQTLQHIKNKADPQNRLHALRWALQAQQSNKLVWHPRPDVDFYKQQVLGFERIHSVLNLSTAEYTALAQNTTRFFQVHQEVVRTYCKNTALEIKLLEHMLPMLLNGQVTAYLTYQEGKAQPAVLGIQYLPT